MFYVYVGLLECTRQKKQSKHHVNWFLQIFQMLLVFNAFKRFYYCVTEWGQVSLSPKAKTKDLDQTLV